MDAFTARALELANRQAPGPGGQPWALRHIEGCAVTSDACSGGLSRFYKAVIRQPVSCHWCCICHDFLYSVGGDSLDRLMADNLLRECAATSGKFEGWRAPFRRGWRWIRAEVMWVVVRAAGWRYWSK